MKSGRPVFTLTNIAFLILSLGYLAGEFIFNVRLLDVAGSVQADPQDVEDIADFGRAIAACGFTLLALGFFSRVDFRPTGPFHLASFYLFAGLCLIPMLFLKAGRTELYFAIIPIFGIFLMTVSRGRFAFHTVLAVMLVAWPTMYFGQKILIETFVDQTTWQERQEARNILMLRSGIEDCIVELQGQWLCAGDKAGPEVRAVRVMITALWMHNPEKILADIAPQRDRIMHNTALRGGWFSPRAQYEKYVKAAGDKRAEIEKEMIDKYYAPYKKASDIYMASVDPVKTRDESDRIWREIDRKAEEGWQRYLQAAREYRARMRNTSYESMTRYGGVLQKMDDFCARHGCPLGNPDRMIERIENNAESRFIEQTGYPPNVSSKQDFMSYPKSREALESELRQQVAARMGIPDFRLPYDWYYDETYFKQVIGSLMRQKVAQQWQRKFGADLKPGLSPGDFFSFHKMPPLPPVDKLVMSEADFTRTLALPQSLAIVRQMMASMEAEGPLYANGQSLEHKGKDYIRTVYIPSIALVLSLAIVLMTVVRGLNAALKLALRGGAKAWRISARHLRAGAIAGFILLLAALPYAFSNSFTAASVYKNYVSRARSENVVTASLLDWAIHMQPLIYTFGGKLAR